MIHDQNRVVSVLLAPASQTNSATRTANLDTINADYARIVVPMASAINTNAVGPTLTLKESDDTVTTNFATWATGCTRTAVTITNAHQEVFLVDCRSRKRYIQLSLTTATATNDNVTASAIAETSRLSILPSGTAGMIGSTNDNCVIL